MLPNRRTRADGNPLHSATTHGALGTGQYAGVGLQFALTILVFVGIGYWLDEKWNTRPWLLIAGTFFGATGAFISLVRKFPTSKRPSERDPEPPSSD